MRPECCPTCAADPKAAPQRYCVRGGTCYCHHPECPAHPDYVPPAMPENVHPLIPWKEAAT